MKTEITQHVKEMMAAFFKISIDEINTASSVDTIEAWDSLNHMKLVMALEEAYDIELTEEEVAELLSFELIMLTLEAKDVI